VTPLLVILGAVVGAPARYLIDRSVQRRHDTAFPWGTFAVNMSGSFLLGFLAAGTRAFGLPAEVSALLGTGLCGALTTYSTFGYETVRLLETRHRFPAVANVAASVLAGLGAAFCGAAIASAF
jgi:fluoride exporter